MVVALIPAPAGMPGLPLSGPDSRLAILADRVAGAERHQVMGNRGGRHRVWLPDTAPRATPLAIALPGGPDAVLRSFAADGLIRAVQGLPRGSTPQFRLTPYQRHRLALLLAVLDAREAGGRVRDIAASVVYPRMESLRGAAWAGSSERRQTYRLIEEARGIAAGGYRALLRGEFPKM